MYVLRFFRLDMSGEYSFLRLLVAYIFVSNHKYHRSDTSHAQWSLFRASGIDKTATICITIPSTSCRQYGYLWDKAALSTCYSASNHSTSGNREKCRTSDSETMFWIMVHLCNYTNVSFIHHLKAKIN